MAGLPHKVKLAINTKTYQDDEGDDFTVSMSVYDKDDFTGLGMVCYPFFTLKMLLEYSSKNYRNINL